MNIWLIISFIAGIISVGAAVAYFNWVKAQDVGSERAQEVAGWIRDGAQSYLKKLYGALGLLAGGLASGFALAIMMANAGGAWDNAKKYIEEGHHGGKGSDAHKAAVVGDTVGDPFKDTSGPSLNILIKLMSMVSVVFAGLVVFFDSGQGLISMLFGG